MGAPRARHCRRLPLQCCAVLANSAQPASGDSTEFKMSSQQTPGAALPHSNRSELLFTLEDRRRDLQRGAYWEGGKGSSWRRFSEWIEFAERL